MSTEKIMNAIGEISDKHIEEAAVVKPFARRKKTWIKTSAAAACACMLIVAAALFASKNNTPDNKSALEYWRGDFGLCEVNESFYITESLRREMENTDEGNGVMTVYVYESSGASRESVYERLIKPMNVEEEFMEREVIFVTAEQINSLVCPPDLKVLLMPAASLDNAFSVNEKESAAEGKIKVNVYLKIDLMALDEKYKEQFDELTAEGKYDERFAMRISAIKEEVNRILDEILNDYGIAYEELDSVVTFVPKFVAELDIDLVERLSEDERISGISECLKESGYLEDY